VLARIGEADEVTRVSAFQAELPPSGPSRIKMLADWAAPGVVPLADFVSYAGQQETTGFRRWAETLASDGVVQGFVRDMPPNEQESLAEEEVRSCLAVPVFAGDRWWGFLAFDDCVTEREWTFPEIEALRAAGGILGAAIHSEGERRRLRDAESRYRALVEQIPAVAYIDALEGPNTTLYISPQTESMLGLTQDQWMADPRLLSKHVHPDDRVRWKTAIDESDATGEPLSVEYRICTPDGRVVWVHDEAVLVLDADGVPRFWHGVMFDITVRKEAERALLDALERERTATQQLRTLDDMKNTFLEAVSHELRTPLTSILGAALTLEREDLALSKEDTRDLVDRLAANARKLRRLLSDLLDLDRLSRGIVEPNRQPTDVAELARLVLAESDMLNGRHVQVEAGSVTVSVDGPKVERIIENLLANTARHTPEDTRVWLRVGYVDDGALISVVAAAPGIPEELRLSVFEPFHQLSAGGSHSPGVGIGLTLVARFAELHGGRAWVEEREGGGAAFRVFLPGPPRVAVPP